MDVVNFIRINLPTYKSYSDKQILGIINQHIEYGTISILLKDKKIIGLLRINIDSNIADVCDMIIAKGYNSRIIIRQMALELWNKFPYLKYFRFCRLIKYPLKKERIYTIKRLVKIK